MSVPFFATVPFVFGLILTCGCAAELSTTYRIERSGQDTVVRSLPNGSIVFDTGVADTSVGSDTDTDLQGNEEFFFGCLWTFRQRLQLCDGGSCGDAEILAHDLQSRLFDFYHDRSNAPPLEEAAWLTFATHLEQRRDMAEGCPGLIVTALFFIAEVFTLTNLNKAANFAREAELHAVSVQSRSPELFQTMMDMFPVQDAWAGYQRAQLSLKDLTVGIKPPGPSVDIVISRCRSPLQWLWELEFPETARLFVYSKCDHGMQDFEQQTSGLQGAVLSVKQQVVSDDSNKGLMTGECTAYLTHIINSLRENSVADFVIFLHDDAPRHIQTALLSLVLSGIRNGAYHEPFLHLSHERYPSFRTPCLKQVYKQIFNEELPGSLSTYCCAHFVVHRSRIEARSIDFYKHVFDLVAQAPYSLEQGGKCNVGRKPCYVMEFMWHHLFGENLELQTRAKKSDLHLALRYEGGRVSRLPSTLAVAPYMAFFRPSRFSSKLAASSG